MRFRLLAAALIGVATSACADRGAEGTDTSAAIAAAGDSAVATATPDSGVMEPGTATATNASLADPSTVTDLDQTVSAAEGGLTKLAPAAAITVIRRFEDKLDNSNDPALTDIAKDLEKLREELDDDTIDGKETGDILKRLGEKVTKVAAKPGAPAQLTRLGAALSAQGKKLDP
jgi:hypothetical protein